MDAVYDKGILSRHQVPRHRLTLDDYRAGIREFWVVDLTDNRVLVHRDPADGRYGSIAIVDISGVLQVEALAGVMVPVARIFV
jgi:Uma2 family endonuclease